MKINQHILSLPPYISTQWSNIRALHMKGALLVVSLYDGDAVAIPGLSPEVINEIFMAHGMHLESKINEQPPLSSQEKNFQGKMPANPFAQTIVFGDQNMEQAFRFGVGLEGFASALHHNPAQMNAPDLPKLVLDKIAAIAKIVAPEDANLLPKAEPHCNCVHCQIARAMTLQTENASFLEDEEKEEPISERDLAFQQWNIEQSGDKLYTVMNRLDTTEKYSVYLGHPVGCTCGREGCEHILAVLKS